MSTRHIVSRGLTVTASAAAASPTVQASRCAIQVTRMRAVAESRWQSRTSTNSSQRRTTAPTTVHRPLPASSLTTLHRTQHSVRFASTTSTPEDSSTSSDVPAAETTSSTDANVTIATVEPFPISVNNCTALVALHARLRLPASIELSTLACALNCQSSALAASYPNNAALARLGGQLIEFYASEFIICTYPRLPMEVIKEALWSYTGDDSLTMVGRGWGVERQAPEIGPKGAIEPLELVDSFGVLKYGRMVVGRANGITEYADAAAAEGKSSAQLQRYSEAMSSFVRAVVGGIHLHEGRNAAHAFIVAHILSRKLDTATLFRIAQPTRELARLCARENFAPPVSRMIAETGRLSEGPVFVVGVYSGSNVLGTGEGASVREAETRAAINALKSWYLYSPGSEFPSVTEGDLASKFTPMYVDPGQVIV
ncbi:mitochondrial 54S ribosomal protein mL44 [Limtongia smithiae]|uniref:mitochondrial 54S ribosomal protein mL44 n=1 Tax=Limtongia smithiae TaxID=1125753 RepID=UPI0034CE9A4A